MSYLKQLHSKIADFNEKNETLHSSQMQCKSGCYKCCLVDLSVFEVEANLIREWFHALEVNEQNNLKLKWKNNKVVVEENFHQKKVSACHFLMGGNCSIYEARPVICRTQGLPLLYRNEESFFFDSCPLNFTEGAPSSKDCLNLDQLNLMLSQIENHDAGGKSRERIQLSALLKELME